jgi:trehalose 6-phosphate synthase/phosphatase
LKRRIALFLDYDGTLREIEREPVAAEPTPPVHDLLKRLSNLSNVDVTVVSGRSRDDLQAWFGAYPFRLIAEHGASRRQPGALVWEQLDRTVNYAWKKELLNILRLYEEATPGSFKMLIASLALPQGRPGVRCMESAQAHSAIGGLDGQPADSGVSW